MQNYIDARFEEVKLVSKFDVEKEETLLALSVYDFYFHLLIRSNHPEHGQADKAG